MKVMLLPACLVFSMGVVQADPLTAADREALLESLEKLKESAESRVAERFRAAVAAYREALASDDATMNFYLKCVEKVDFTDQQKKNADFRGWKRKEADRLADAGFRLALRAQLQWLTFYLRSASEDADLAALAAEAQTIVDAVYEDSSRLRSQQGTLGQAVTGTVFARAYGIGDFEKVKWPQSPVQLDAFYEQVVFPLYRSPSKLESLRAAWQKRIRQETVRAGVEAGGDGARRNGNASRSQDEDRFATDTLPELQWQMELDLFRSGDQSGAAKRMLEHIGSHITHRSARAWGDQFRALLTPPPKPSPAGSPGLETP